MRDSQQDIKEAMHEKVLEQLKDPDVQIISLSSNQENISWEENGKEFSLNGQMYDVVKTVKENGQILLYCINDIKEKQLVDSYNEITKHNSSSGKKEKSIDNLINLFVEVKGEENPISLLLGTNAFPSFITRLQYVTPKNYAPPPEV